MCKNQNKERKMKGNIFKFTKGILNLMFIIGVVTVITLPLSLKYYGENIDYAMQDYLGQMIFIFAISGIFSLAIVFELIKMFKTVLRDDCFVKENVISLNRMCWYSMGIAVMMLVKCIFYITVGTLAMGFVFLIAGLFSKVLAQVFDKAITYKLENDLTI